jgi:uncharacterized protein with NRDE domain
VPISIIFKMCLLAILYRVVDDCPIIVAANREESYERQGTTPQLWSRSPEILAGKDPRAGGTWLGVNDRGLLVAITNRPKHLAAPDRSRGLLCADLLSCGSATLAREQAMRELSARSYAGCNLLIVDAAHGYIIHYSEKPDAHSLEPGVHALSQSDLNQPTDPRIIRTLDWLKRYRSSAPSHSRKSLSNWLRVLRDICKDHGDANQPPICLHRGDRGTVSSSIIALADDSSAAVWQHAQGPPCQTPYIDLSHLIRSLLRSGAPAGSATQALRTSR